MPLKEITQLRLFIGCDDEFVGKCGNYFIMCSIKGRPKKGVNAFDLSHSL